MHVHKWYILRVFHTHVLLALVELTLLMYTHSYNMTPIYTIFVCINARMYLRVYFPNIECHMSIFVYTVIMVVYFLLFFFSPLLLWLNDSENWGLHKMLCEYHKFFERCHTNKTIDVSVYSCVCAEQLIKIVKWCMLLSFFLFCHIKNVWDSILCCYRKYFWDEKKHKPNVN